MLDTSKLPHLQPKEEKKPEEEDPLEETLWEQVLHVFSGTKGIMLACGIALLIYISVCFQGERALRTGVYGVLKEMGADGFGVSYSAPSSYLALKSGLYLDDLVITAPEKMGGWVLRAGRVTVTANPFFPRSVSIKMNGTHSLTTKRIGDIRLVVGGSEAELTLPSKKEGFSFQAEFKNIQAVAPKSMDGFAVSDFILNVRADAVKQDGTTAYAFFVKSDGISLPAYLSQYLPPRIQYMKAGGTVSGFSAQRTKPFLTDWTDNSGLIEISQGEIIWEPFMAQITGTLGFTASYDTIGAMIAKMYNFFDLLDMFEKGGYVRLSQVSLAKVVLGERLKQEEGESQPSISTSISLQDGKIYVGQVLLYEENQD